MNEDMHLSPQGAHFLKLAEGEDISQPFVETAEAEIRKRITRTLSQPLFDMLVSLFYSLGAFNCGRVVHDINHGHADRLLVSWMGLATAKDPHSIKRRASELQFLGAYHAHEPKRLIGPFIPTAWHYWAPILMGLLGYGVHRYFQVG